MANENIYHVQQKSTQLSPNDVPLEKDWNGHRLPDNQSDMENVLKRNQTPGSISISPELFEKIYLSPQNAVKGNLRSTFGNPTPIALIGFLLSLTPLSCDLMGWRGTTDGSAGIATYFFFGGLLMILGGLGEWILGNTFPSVVFVSFGAFWLSFGGTLQPFYSSYGNFSPDPSNLAEGLAEPAFQAGFGFFLLAMDIMCFLYMILSLRTNVVFFMIFLCLVCAFGCLTATYWHLAQGSVITATRLQVAGGAFAFATSIFGWYIFFAIMLASLDFPFQLPVGDLASLIPPGSENRKQKDQESQEV